MPSFWSLIIGKSTAEYAGAELKVEWAVVKSAIKYLENKLILLVNFVLNSATLAKRLEKEAWCVLSAVRCLDGVFILRLRAA